MTPDLLQVFPESIRVLAHALHMVGAVRRDLLKLSPDVLHQALGSDIAAERAVYYADVMVMVLVPGRSLHKYTGQRRVPPVSGHALDLALCAEMALRLENSSLRFDAGVIDALQSVQIYRRRHLLVTQMDDGGGWIHAPRTQPPAPVTVLRLLHDLLGGDHEDPRFGERRDLDLRYPPAQLTCYLAPLALEFLKASLGPSREKGGLDLQPLDLDRWPYL